MNVWSVAGRGTPQNLVSWIYHFQGYHFSSRDTRGIHNAAMKKNWGTSTYDRYLLTLNNHSIDADVRSCPWRYLAGCIARFKHIIPICFEPEMAPMFNSSELSIAAFVWIWLQGWLKCNMRFISRLRLSVTGRFDIWSERLLRINIILRVRFNFDEIRALRETHCNHRKFAE